jgi:thymidylate synthase ThyX
MIKAEIICDSRNSCGNRLITFILEYPRFIHAELMTHRMFSKNSASSRAIPFEKFIEQIKKNPAMPVFWGKNQKGMQAIEELDDKDKKHKLNYWHEVSYSDKELAMICWLESRDKAIEQAEKLNKLGLHKQIINRILEPWFNIRVILSGTEFDNFFALRAHRDAQPELQKLSYLMLEEYNKSEPKKLKEGEWHIPFGDKIEENRLEAIIKMKHGVYEDFINAKKKIAIARCARISYFNYDGNDDYEADIKLCDRLFANNPKHLSPTEHIAQALETNEWCGNFRGFKQYRKFFKDENLKDERVIIK